MKRKSINVGKNNPNWKPKIQLICPECNKVFETTLNNIVKYKRKYCSRTCSDKAKKGSQLSLYHCKRISEGLTGHKVSLQARMNISKATKGTKISEIARKNIIKGLTGKKHKESTKQKMKKNMLKLWKNPEYREKQLAVIFKGYNIKPNKMEEKLNKILQNIFPGEYLLNIAGDVIIGRKIPDFVNINGQKKLIEFNGDYWHGFELTGRTKEEEEKQRIDHFAKYGYQTLIIWESELNNLQNTREKIIEFNRRKS
jgi:very-short-patch-repair endonuclease